MNILILTHIYPDEKNRWRGIFVRDQASTLSTDHNVTVVYFRGDNSRLAPFKKAFWSENIRGTVTEYTVTVPRSLPVINQLVLLGSVYRFISGHILKYRKIDLIHSHMSYPGGFLGTIIQKIKGIHNIVTEHSWVRQHFRSPVHRICVLYTLNNCSRIVAVSNALKENISKYTQRQISVIHNLVSEERFNISGREAGDIINLGILGSYDTPRKGLDILLTAVSLKPDKRIRLHVGGKGALLEGYKSMASELGIDHLCIFHGEILPGNVPDFFSGLDIYVLASRSETFGVVVIEALASGIPVISTRCGGPEDIMTPSTGIMVESENAESLAEAISGMLHNHSSFNRPAIRKYVLDHFGSKAFLGKINMLYSEITSLPLTKQNS